MNQLYRSIHHIVAALLLLSLGLSTGVQGQSASTEADNQRYLALLLLNLPIEKGPELELIRTAHNYGLNAVYIAIPWDKVYQQSPTETPKWEKFDEQIQLATSLGMKVALRIHLGRHSTRINGFWEESDSQWSQFDTPLLGGYQDTAFGFDNQPIVNKGLAFIKEVTNRYKYLQTEQKLLFISVTNTPTQEGEYYSTILKDGKEVPTVYDYSPSMHKGFQEWLKTNYKKIERMNFLWGTHYKSFDEAHAPSTPWEPDQAFRQRFGKDWYIYRHLVFKKYVEQTVDAIKSVDANIKVISDYGSVFDGASLRRGTLAYMDLNEKTDGIKVNDDLVSFDHRWSVDILKSASPSNYLIANELFVNEFLDNTIHQKQIDENFAHGAKVVAALISTTKTLQRSEPYLRAAAANWLNKPMPPIVYTDSVGYRLSDAVEKKGAQNVIYQAWAQKAYADPNNPRPIKVVLNEDLLQPSYWDDASNYPPYILRPIPMQIVAVNKDFSYKLPTDTFSDVDGTIAKMVASGLPAWLKFENGTLWGKPTTLGDFRIKVTGTDDEGGSTEAFFTIRVDTQENANRPPTVNSNFSNQTIAINEAFSLPIPEDAFIDVDGKITKIEAFDLPNWLKYENRVLSGTPTSLGESRIFLKAYDDLNAFVETYFTIKVVEPQFLNQPPYASSPFPVKYVSVNYPFEYVLPNVFGDNDGYISSISIQNRPSWLDLSLNVLSGTPTEEGEYRLIIRAYDNGGAYVEIPLILIVEIPRLRFELVRGGRAIDQSIIRKLEGDNVIPYDQMPPLINIYAYGNFDYDRVNFDLTGPFHYSSSTNKFPYALYDNESGFPPMAGRYTLTVKATSRDSTVVSNSIQFSISKGDSLDIVGDIPAWDFYPNPVTDVLNIRLPNDKNNLLIEYALVTSSGKIIPVPKEYVTTADNLSNIALYKMFLPAGIYLVRLSSEGQLLKQYRIFKK
ncbi:putative secreted protein (Por secretion system target) [Dyadobacter jejuensis]|uniref:Putative secreted protein (Por secretion system target) n=1 Tax=Dyadobacter jejuensis TaxID=1082580 RepID=A0A316AHC2_9BACT|nr:putative Ig domain-containing protein [Dyadobacter jejuensis]PWJ57031.1 putative secreted protein (Por secretion system target) [Dyadobacter jejuensis]